jgi:hypothetical protein
MGFFWGMMAGIIGALTFPPLLGGLFESVASDIIPLYMFPLLLVVSGVACVATSLLTKPDDPEVLKTFYRTVRPWGFWGPIHDMVVAEDPTFERNKNFKRDMFNVTIGIIAQTCLVAAPIFLVVRENISMATTLVVFAICATILKKTWYDTLEEETS